jgi:D-inositol-3-phosphate glycosyltransferase
MIREQLHIGFLATLPPARGVSDYAVGFLSNVPKDLRVYVYTITKTVPSLLYPGGIQTTGHNGNLHLPNNVRVVADLSYYDISRWVRIGLTTKTRIFHIHWWTPFLLIPYMALILPLRIRRVKVILTVHNVLPHEHKALDFLASSLLLRFADHIIVHTKSGKTTLGKTTGIKQSKISVFPHGFLKPTSYVKMDKDEAKARLGLSKDTKVVLFFGNIRHYKGLDVLIDAMAEIVKVRKDVQLVVAGMPWRGGAEIKNHIERCGLNEYTHLFLRFIPPDDLPGFFQCADIVALPYRYFDSQTGVGAYALYFEKPMVVTNVGGLPSLVRDQSVIVPPENAGLFAKAVLRVLGTPNLIMKLSDDSRDLKKEFDWGEIVVETAQVYHRLLEDH